MADTFAGGRRGRGREEETEEEEKEENGEVEGKKRGRRKRTERSGIPGARFWGCGADGGGGGGGGVARACAAVSQQGERKTEGRDRKTQTRSSKGLWLHSRTAPRPQLCPENGSLSFIPAHFGIAAKWERARESERKRERERDSLRVLV